MANGTYIAMSASLAAWTRMETTANNLANVNTPGYKQLKTTFGEFLVPTNDDTPAQKGFTALTLTQVDGAPGSLLATGNPLDAAIDGEGHFLVRAGNSVRLTRAGNFRMQPDGTLVGPAGLPVLAGDPQSGTFPVRVQPNGGPVVIGPAGDVTQDGTTIARLAIVTVEPEKLKPVGDATYDAPIRDLVVVPQPNLKSGYIEASNVNPLKGMIDLIEVSKDYARSERIQSQYQQLDSKTLAVTR